MRVQDEKPLDLDIWARNYECYRQAWQRLKGLEMTLWSLNPKP